MIQNNHPNGGENLEAEIKALGLQLLLNGIRSADHWSQKNQWITNRVEAQYPTPRDLPRAPSGPPLSPLSFLFFAAILVLPTTTAVGIASGAPTTHAVLIAVIIIFWVGYILVWAIIGAWSSWYKSAEAEYQELWDPYRRHRLALQSAIEHHLRRFFTYAVTEAFRPLPTVPPSQLAEYPRPELAWEPQGPRPDPRMVCNPRDAEYLAMYWMRYLGAEDCHVSPATRDGGADVVSMDFVAEVKHHAEPVSPAYVRQIFGVATAENKKALFFSLSGYSDAAIEFGEKAGVALFTYDFQNGTLRAASSRGRRALSEGIPSIV